VDLRTAAVRPVLSLADDRQRVPPRVPAARTVHPLSRPAARPVERPRTPLRLLRDRLLAAGLPPRRPDRAMRAAGARALHGCHRPRVVRMVVPADGLHGDAVPEAGVLAGWIRRPAAPARPRPLESRADRARRPEAGA